MPAIEAMAARAKADPMVFGVDRSAVPFRFSPDYVPEPEPVELTVEDVITSLEYTALTCDLRLAKRDPSGVGEIRTGSISWSKWAPKEHETPAGFSLWTADEEAELFRADNVRDVLIEAKRRKLLG